MSYLGRGTDKISNIEILDNITFDGSSSYSITKNSVAFTPNSAQSLLISIDGVVQATNFTVSSSTIDFGVAIPSTSSCDFFLHYGTGLITTPADGTVTAPKLASSSITGQTAETSANDSDSILIYDDSATALRKMTRSNFLTGVGGTNTPAFQANLSSNQSLSASTTVKIQFDTEDYDTDNDYDNSTNYRFTISEAGKYYFYTNIVLSDSVNERAIAIFKINGTAYGRMETYSNVSGADPNLFTAFSKDFSVNDYVEVFVEAGSSGATARAQAGETIFGGYKLIGA